MQRSDRSPQEVIDSLGGEQRADVQRLHEELSRVMDGLEQYVIEGRFWGGSEQQIICYGHHRSVNRSGKAVDWFIAGLAAQKGYVSVYVTAVEDGRYLSEAYRDRLGKVKVGRSNVSFKRLTDVNLDALLELVGRARELMTQRPSAGG